MNSLFPIRGGVFTADPAPLLSTRAKAMPLRPWLLLVLLPSWLLSAIGCGEADNQYQPPPPPKVSVSTPVQRTITVYKEENGQLEATQLANVRARVRGFLEEVAFEAGQMVREGDLLYRIEEDQYKAEFDAAQASLAAAKAAVTVALASQEKYASEAARAERELTRQEELVQQNAISESEYESTRATRDAALANLASAEANIEAARSEVGLAEARLQQAQLNLDYCTVEAPISGRITQTLVKRGNLVENGTELATIIDREQIYANFSISDREALRLKESRPAVENGDEGPQWWRQFAIYLRREIDQQFRFQGRLNYVSQEGADEDTGTLGVRAQFDNPDGDLLPGLFVRLRIPLQQIEDALLVPEKALQKNQLGTSLLVIGSDNTVVTKTVTIGEKIDGWAEIRSGLAADDRVIYEGLQRAMPGNKVDPDDQPLSIPEDAMLSLPIRVDEGQSDTAAPDAPRSDSDSSVNAPENDEG